MIPRIIFVLSTLTLLLTAALGTAAQVKTTPKFDIQSAASSGRGTSPPTATQSMTLLDPNFVSTKAGGGVTPLQIASSTPYTGTLDKNYFGIYIDIDRGGDNSYFQTSGIRTWTNYSGSSADYPAVTGGEFITTNTNSTGAAQILQGSEGWATCTADCYEVQGATGFANSSSGIKVFNAHAGYFQSGTSPRHR
jgi:hypothetical protein